mmetsp:Transcript_5725/g.15030  ORF Transcript_5725/g.15030 Transcript_5725/m.15030 type:complete len:153 (+) Transcript_5725:96-554(+)
MPIIYAVVARGSRVQAEYAATSGNFATIARKILERVQSEGEETRRSYAYDGHVFHILVDQELVFMCMCDTEFGRVLPFQFLNEICKRWRASRGDNLTVSFAGGNVRARAHRPDALSLVLLALTVRVAHCDARARPCPRPRVGVRVRAARPDE